MAVDGGERAVMVSAANGVLPKPVGEGTHPMIPYLYTPHIFSIRAEPKEIKSRTGTKDLQTVQIALRILSKPKVRNYGLRNSCRFYEIFYVKLHICFLIPG